MYMVFPCVSAGKESTCNVGDLCSTLGWEDSLKKGKATHSSIVAWRIPWTVKATHSSILAWRIPRTVEFIGSQKAGHTWVTFTFTYEYRQTSLFFFFFPIFAALGLCGGVQGLL